MAIIITMSIAPGTNTAANWAVTLTLTTVAQIINTIAGGNTSPSSPAHACSAPASARVYPLLINSGRKTLPRVAVSAMGLPVMLARIPAAATQLSPTPPGIHPSTAVRNRPRSAAKPVFATRPPRSMNSGSAMNATS